MDDKLVKLYIDMAHWAEPIKVDDFLVTIGVKQSNSVYHVAEVRASPKPEKRIVRYHVKCYRSDLMTCLARDEDQQLITMRWYSRKKKSNG